MTRSLATILAGLLALAFSPTLGAGASTPAIPSLEGALQRSLSPKDRAYVTEVFKEVEGLSGPPLTPIIARRRSTVFLVCFSARIAAYFKFGGAACADVHGKIYYLVGGRVGLTVGVGATSYLLMYRGLPGKIRGAYSGAVGAFPLFLSPLPIVGPKIGYFLGHDGTTSLTVFGGSFGPMVDFAAETFWIR